MVREGLSEGVTFARTMPCKDLEEQLLQAGTDQVQTTGVEIRNRNKVMWLEPRETGIREWNRGCMKGYGKKGTGIFFWSQQGSHCRVRSRGNK